MESQTAELRVQIVRPVVDHQPLIVACEFMDAGGRKHTVTDKVWIFSDSTLDAHSQYPQVGVIRCALMAEWRDETGWELCRINTALPFHIESSEGLTEFIVLRDQLSTA
jgi:hypothetical protein